MTSLRELAWFRSLDADLAAAVGVVAQAGIADFLSWLDDPAADPTPAFAAFRAVPREVSRQVTLAQTVELVRRCVEVVEASIDELAGPGETTALRESALRYGREVAFAAATVYARAAEEQGAWHARVAAQLVDGLAAGAPARLLGSRAAPLGLGPGVPVAVAVATVDIEDAEDTVEWVRRAAARLRTAAVCGLSGSALVVVLPAGDSEADSAELLGRLLPAGLTAVLGPVAPSAAEAAESAATALGALAVLAALPETEPVVRAARLLPYRVLAGDGEARAALTTAVFTPLAEAGGDLLTTVRCYLEIAASLQDCARRLFIHANTVRYRLRRVEVLTGLRPTDPQEAFLLRIAIAVGVLSSPDPAAAPVKHPAADLPSPL